MGDRMRAWMKENGAKHVAEGYRSYFEDGAEEAVRPGMRSFLIGEPTGPSVEDQADPYWRDDEIADAEIVDDPNV